MERFKSPVVWLAVMAQVLLVVTLFAPQFSEQVKIIATAVIEILTLVGVLNNPTNPNGF